VVTIYIDAAILEKRKKEENAWDAFYISADCSELFIEINFKNCAKSSLHNCFKLFTLSSLFCDEWSLCGLSFFNDVT